MNINVLAIDIAKNVFQLCAMDKTGHIVKEKRVQRADFLKAIDELSPKAIAMEACGSANYWSRELLQWGYEVKLISPQHVKPFVKGNKNDKCDARAIGEASQRPTMNFVTPKSVEQQDMQSLLRIRNGYIELRTKLCNQTRGLLGEYGIIESKSIHKLRIKLPELFDRSIENNLTIQMKEWLEMQYEMLLVLEENIACCDIDIARIVKASESCQRLKAIEGVGDITAVAIVAQVGNGSEFKNGRHLSAYFGLVPRQYSSGDKQVLRGISKRGDTFIRKLLIHGGRSVVQRVDNKTDARSQWIKRIKAERGYNRASVAVANKNTRIILAMLKSGEAYRQAA